MPGSPPLSNRSAAPLHLILERSRCLERAVVVLHLLGLGAALATPMAGWVKALLTVAVIVSGIVAWRRLDRVRGLTLAADGDWEVVSRDGIHHAHLAATTVVTPWIIILHLNSDGGTLALPICRDATDPESFRRLRVHLRIAGPLARRSPEA